MAAMPARQIEFSREEILRAEAAAELECRRCFGYEEDGKHIEGDGVYFVENYVHIEDRSSGKPQWVLFKLWPCQLRVWATLLVERFILILKARQLGLTWLLVAFALWRMMAIPGFRVLGLSKKYDFAKVNLLERLVNMLKRLPRWMIRQRIKSENWKSFAGHTWERVGDEIRIYHPLQGSTVQELSIFSIMATTSDGARSFTADLIILDEYAYAENPEEMWSAMVPVIDQPGSTQQGVLLSTNQAGTHFDELVTEASEGRGTFAKGFIFLEWFQHPLRDMAWYESAKEKDPLYYRREYPATIEDSRSVASGTFFQKFSKQIHSIDPFDIPPWWKRWLANDPGYTDPFCWHWMAVDEDGVVYVYREYAPRQSKQDERITYSEQAREVAKLSRLPEPGPDGQPQYERFEFLVTGHDACTKHPETGKSIADYYLEAFRETGFSVGIIPTIPDRARRAAVMTEYIEPYEDQNTNETRAKVRIFNTCTYVLKALPMMVCHENQPEKYADHPADHPVDCLGYGLQQWHPEKAKEPESAKTVIQQDKQALADKARLARRRLRLRSA
ncbi:MAG TPA: hypothetical protein GX716_01595 [Firmicutes bacterium]|nr:hypothetical protein [Candidatus Fermentithermobacillaceae bacterium]